MDSKINNPLMKELKEVSEVHFGHEIQDADKGRILEVRHRVQGGDYRIDSGKQPWSSGRGLETDRIQKIGGSNKTVVLLLLSYPRSNPRFLAAIDVAAPRIGLAARTKEPSSNYRNGNFLWPVTWPVDWAVYGKVA